MSRTRLLLLAAAAALAMVLSTWTPSPCSALELELLDAVRAPRHTRAPAVKPSSSKPSKSKPPTKAPSVAVPPQALACRTDADCVALQDPRCCQDCHHVACNKNSTEACLKPYGPQCNAQCLVPCVPKSEAVICSADTFQCTMTPTWQIPCGAKMLVDHVCPSGFACVGVNRDHTDQPGRCFKKQTCKQASDCGSPLQTCSKQGLCAPHVPKRFNATALACGGPDNVACPSPADACVRNPLDATCDFGVEPSCVGVCVKGPSVSCANVKCMAGTTCTECPGPVAPRTRPVCLAQGATCPPVKG